MIWTGSTHLPSNLYPQVVKGPEYIKMSTMGLKIMSSTRTQWKSISKKYYHMTKLTFKISGISANKKNNSGTFFSVLFSQISWNLQPSISPPQQNWSPVVNFPGGHRIEFMGFCKLLGVWAQRMGEREAAVPGSCIFPRLSLPSYTLLGWQSECRLDISSFFTRLCEKGSGLWCCWMIDPSWDDTESGEERWGHGETMS